MIVMSKIDFNTCYYSEGTGHSCCTHPFYCIFNNNRFQHEKEINDVLCELDFSKSLLKMMEAGFVFFNMDYDGVVKLVDMLVEDLSMLMEFDRKIKGNEVDGYEC